jgi:hypothetical protein
MNCGVLVACNMFAEDDANINLSLRDCCVSISYQLSASQVDHGLSFARERYYYYGDNNCYCRHSRTSSVYYIIIRQDVVCHFLKNLLVCACKKVYYGGVDNK